MTSVSEILSSDWVHRLGWTLLHSLWQIAALAAVLAILLAVLRRRTANTRYVTACAGLLVMLVLPAVTYCLVPDRPVAEVTAERVTSPLISEPTPPPVVPSAAAPSIAEPPPFAVPDVPDRASVPAVDPPMVPLPPPATPLPERVLQTISPWMPWLVVVWFAGVCLLSLWHLGGWIALQRLKHLGTTPAPEPLAHRLAELIERMQLSRPVRMLQSAVVDVAAVIGWLRPVLLLPAAMLGEMSPQQIDAVLAHELAHVRRYDYLVNLLQTVIETLLFYHPGVWWLSRRIRIEREHCCDDAAVALCGSSLDYAAALMAVEQGRAAPRLAVAAGGADRGGTALSRVRRVLNLSGRDPVRPQTWLVGVFTVVALAGLLAGYIATAGEQPHKPDQAAEQGPEEEEAGEGTEETAQPADLKLEARVVGIDGKTPERSLITFWEAIDPETLKKSDKGEGHPGFDDVPHVWQDRAAGKTWRPIQHVGAGDRATKEGLEPGDYRVTAFVGHGSPTMLAVSDPVHLDGSRKHTVLTLRIQDGPSLKIEVVDARTGKPIEYAAIRLVRSDGLAVVRWSSTWSVHPRGNEYTFEHLAPGEYTLDVFKRAYRYGDQEYAAEQGPIELRLAANQDRQMAVKLKAVGPSEEEARRRWPWAVTGTVTDAQGRPLQDVQLRASCGWGTLWPTGETVTDKQGKYTLRFGPGMRIRKDDGTWGAGVQAATIYAFKPGHTEKNLCRQGGLLMGDKLPAKGDPYYGDRDRVVVRNQPRRLDFVMVAAAGLEGELVDEQGEPIGDRQISVRGKQMLPSTSVLAQGKTDREGRFRFEGIPANYGWWFSVAGQGRTQPITFPGPGVYRVKLQLTHYAQYNLDVFRITSVTDPEGNEVGDKLVGDDPSARPPVDEELQEQGRSYLRKMAAACRDWLGPPPAEVRNYEYRFRLGDGEPTTHRIGDASRAGGPVRQGITYFGTPHVLCSRPEKVVFRQVEVDRETILLRFLVQDSVKIAAGNGISGTWRGYFSTPLREGLLVLDKTTCRPVRTDIGNVQETFSRYTGLGDGRFVPLAIRIQKGSTDWDWKFRVYRPGLWLLAESRTGDGEGRGELLATVDEVKVNGQPAVPTAQEGAPARPEPPADGQTADWGPAVEGVQVCLRAAKMDWRPGADASFQVDIRNQGTRERFIAYPQSFKVEVDGRWHTANFVASGERRSVGLGGRLTYSLSLGDFLSSRTGDPPTGLRQGRHTIRVALSDVGEREERPDGEKGAIRFGGNEFEAVSNPVQIEIVPTVSGPEDNPLALDDATLIKLFHVGKTLRAAANECNAFHIKYKRPPGGARELFEDYQQFRQGMIADPFASEGDVLRLKTRRDRPDQWMQVWSVGPDGDWDGGKPIDSADPALDGDLGAEMRLGRWSFNWLADDTITLHLEGKRLAHYLAAKGPRLPGRELQDNDLKWGPETDGLRMAARLSPAKAAYALGEKIELEFHVRNVSDHTITIAGFSWRQDAAPDAFVIENESGERLKVGHSWYSGRTPIQRDTLKPGETAVFKSSALAFLAEGVKRPGHPVGHTVMTAPGRHRLQFNLRFPDGGSSGPDGMPRPTDWQGVLATAPVTIHIGEPAKFALFRVLGHRSALPFGGKEKGPRRKILFSGVSDEGDGSRRFDSMRPEYYPLEGLILDKTPLLTEADLVGYDWPKHEIHLKPGVRQRLLRGIKPSVWGVPFAVVAGGEPVYLGAFWTGASSYMANMPTISVDPWQWSLPKTEPHYLPENAIRIENNQALKPGEKPRDPRANPRLRQALDRAGKLIDPRPGAGAERDQPGENEIPAESATGGEETPWGEAVDGVEVRLRCDRPRWQVDETITWKIDARNTGERHLKFTPHAYETVKIDIDGRIFNLPSSRGRVKPYELKPGQEHRNIPFSVSRRWQLKDHPFELAPGKHTVKITWVLYPAKGEAGEPLQVTSNPVEIEIVPGESVAWGTVAAGLQAGVSLVEQSPRVRVGEQRRLQCIVRNVSDRPIQFTTYEPGLRVPLVRRADGTRVDVEGPVFDGPVRIVQHVLAPGQSVTLDVLGCTFCPDHPIYRTGGLTARALTGPGVYKLSCELVLTKSEDADWEGRLETGQIDLEVLSPDRDDLTGRVASMLREGADQFTLKAVYLGDKEKPLRCLRLTTNEPTEGYPAHWITARIDRKQAEAIIDHLGSAGCLWPAAAEPQKQEAIPKPSYFFVVSIGKESEPSRLTDLPLISLGWGLEMLDRLEALRKVLDGRAAQAVDELLGDLQPQRKQWEKAATQR